VGGMSQYCDLLLSLLKELPESSPVLVLCTANVKHMHQLPQSLLEAITLQPEGEQGLNITDLVAFKGYCELGEPNDAARGAFFGSSFFFCSKKNFFKHTACILPLSCSCVYIICIDLQWS
jgi:hypothetical protein